MPFLSSLNISASGMTAQRLRLDIASQNISNMETTRTDAGTPYRRKMVVFQESPQDFRTALRHAENHMHSQNKTGGVVVTEIAEDPTDFEMVYDPEHPDADANGYVAMPNVDLVKETTDAMAATHAYTANITAFNAIKLMAQKALEIGK